MNNGIEDRLRGGLQWQAEQVDKYDVALDRIQDRGMQRRRRTQGLAAGGVAAALALVVAGSLLFDFRSQQAQTTVFADESEEAEALPQIEDEPEPGIEAALPVVDDESSEVSTGLDSLPDLIGVSGSTIVSRRSDATATVLAEAAPAATSNFAPTAAARVVVQDGARGFVQFGRNDIYWTPSAAADQNLVVKITTTGAELGYDAQRLVYGDVFLNEAGNPTVLYGVERTRDGEIRDQRILTRDLLTGERSTVFETDVEDGDDPLVSMTQISNAGGVVAVVRSEPCEVELLDLQGQVASRGIAACPADSFGSISPDGETMALVDFTDRRDIGVSVYSIANGERITRVATDDMEIRPVDHPIDYDGRFVVATRSDVTIVFDTEDESVHTLAFTGPSTISSVASIDSDGSSLRGADTEKPFTRSCPRQGGALVVVRPELDGVARPLCVRADSGQRLAFENDSDAVWQVRFAHIDVDVEPGEVYEDQFALGAYLAPGVHRLSPQPTPIVANEDEAADDADLTDDERTILEGAAAAANAQAAAVAPVGTELWFDPAGRYQIALRQFGPIELGDSFEAANTAIGGVLDPEVAEFALTDGCATTRIGSGLDPTLMLVPELDEAGNETGEVIVAAAIVTRPGVTTLSGLGVGSSTREIVAAYRNRIEIEDSVTFDGGIDLVYTPQSEEDEDFRIVFVADDSQVLSYRSGLANYIMAAGGCDGYLASLEAADGDGE